MTSALEAVSDPEPGGDAPAVDAVPGFEDLYRGSRDDLYAYVTGLLRDRVAAEDVTALAFERALRKWDRFDPGRGSARGWLFGIARNAALDELRKRRREAPLNREPAAAPAPDGAGALAGSAGLLGSPELSDPAAVAAERFAELERRRLVTEALDSLPVADREMVSLKFFSGLTNSEIATATGMSATNVGTRIHRAMTRLRDACKEVSP